MGKKNPKAAFAPTPQKLPSVAVTPLDFHAQRPSWRVRNREMADVWGWHAVNSATLFSVHEKLSHLEARTWGEILVQSKYHNHFVAVWQICKPAQERLDALGYGDQDRVVSLRLSAKERVWGVMENGVLNVLWWDPDHTVYPVEKKHT